MNINILDHTIIIPTKNRPKWINYSLLHYSNFNYKGKILIVDDSDDENFNLNTSIIEKFKSNLSIQHFKGGKKYKKRHKNISNTFSTFLKKIDTTYYSSTSDDDIIYTPNLIKFMKFLDINSDYSAVTATHFIYDLDDNYNLKNLKIFKGNVCFFDDPLDRLMCYANEKGVPHYGVVRTSSRKAIWSSEKKLGWKIFSRENLEGLEYFDEELSWNAQIYISGKIGNLNLIQYFRLNYDGLERIENLYKNTDENNYTLGSIGNIFDGSMTPSCRETFTEFKELVNYEKTQYNDKIIDFTLKQIIWCLIKNYNGAGLLKDETKYKNSLQKKNKFKKKLMINLDFLVLFKISKVIKTIYNQFYFKISTLNIINKFKNNHSKFIKIFL